MCESEAQVVKWSCGQETDGRGGCYSIPLQLSALEHYGRVLGLSTPVLALQTLARAIATSPAWEAWPGTLLIVRSAPFPELDVLGPLDQCGREWLARQAWEANLACRHLQFISYVQAERDCRLLATKLEERFGRDELRRFSYTAMPRGGFIVLGMLAYALGLDDKTRLEPPYPADTPLVLVDDCSLIGKETYRFLRHSAGRQIILAYLYSHPELRASIQAQEPRVVACLSAHDLMDYGPEVYGNNYAMLRAQWWEHLGELHPYWLGAPGHLCFAWNEVGTQLYDPSTRTLVQNLPVVPPELCSKNQPLPGRRSVPVQLQPEGKGPLKPSARAVYGQRAGRLVVGDLKTAESWTLAAVQASMWQAIAEHGNLAAAAAALREMGVGDGATLNLELQEFVRDLVARGLLE